MRTRKFLLSEQEIPDKWYNIVADMPNKPLPPLHFDMKAYQDYFEGKIVSHEVTSGEIKASLAELDTPLVE